jgi:hypothetical protein
MSLYQWGMLLSIIGFIMATLFAALLMEQRVVGPLADKLSDGFGDIHSRLNRHFPLPRRRLITVMYRYSIQTVALALSAVFLKMPHHSLKSPDIWVSAAMIFAAGVLPLILLYREAWADEGSDPDIRLEVRIFAACLVHEIIMLLISPFVLLGIFLLEIVRGLFGFLSYSSDAKKMLVVLGTLVAFVGLILQFAASFA